MSEVEANTPVADAEALQKKLNEALKKLEVVEREKEVYREISEADSLDALLDGLSHLLENIAGVDGLFILVADAERKNLCIKKIKLPAEWKDIENTFKLLKYSLVTDAEDPNVAAYHSKQVVNIDLEDPEQKEDFFLKGYKRWQIKGITALPIINSDDEVFGTVLVYSQKSAVGNDVIEQVKTALSYFNKQLCKAVSMNDLVQMEHSLKEALKNQKKFLEFIEHVNSLTKEDLVYETFQIEMLRRYNFDISMVFMHKGEHLVERKTSIVDPKHTDIQREIIEYFRDTKYDLEPFDGATSTAFMQKTHMFIYDVMKIIDLPMAEKDKKGLDIFKTPRSFLFIPIYRGSEVVGVLWLISLNEPVDVSEDDVSVLKLLCRFLGTCTANAQTYEKVEDQNDKIVDLNASLEQKVLELNELVTKDRLTNLFNFGYFQEELLRRVEEYKRCAGENFVSLVICDIDYFKRFNDTYGHIGGNIALREVAQRIAQQARDMDVVCRYGGEEFVVILPKCDLEGARVFAERVRRIIQLTPVKTDSLAVPVTISIGCACYIPNETMTQFIHRADSALYLAKENGRNRVEVAEE